MPAPRPTKATEETIKLILDNLREGRGRIETCKMAGIDHDTFMNWMRAKSDFSEAVKKAEADGLLAMRESALRSIQKAHEQRDQWQAAAWLLERKFADEFAKREPNANPDVNININVRYEDADTDD